MSSRIVGRLAVAGAIVAAAAVPLTAAQAETCTPLPGTSPGATIEVGDQDVRVPSISGIAVCTDEAGLPGIPWVSTAGCGAPCASVIVTSGSGDPGYVVVRYTVDGVAQELRTDVPGAGGGAEVCYAGVGMPARSDCFVKVHLDNVPLVSPSPTPTPAPTSTPRPVCLNRPVICVDPISVHGIPPLP